MDEDLGDAVLTVVLEPAQLAYISPAVTARYEGNCLRKQ